MILQGYGITLIRIKAEDAELVRTMRNSDPVRKNMRYRDIITPEQQKIWFNSINNAFNNYFLIHFEEKICGLISAAEIDWDQLVTRNGGLFISEPELWGSLIPVNASLLLTEMSFLMGFRRSYIRVLPENERAIRFNQLLGYQSTDNTQYDPLKEYVLTPERFDEATGKLRQILRKQYPSQPTCIIDDPFHPGSAKLIRQWESLAPEEKSRLIFNVKKN